MREETYSELAKQPLQQIVEEIYNHSTIIITRHQRPDGDAYGSSIGLALILRSKFKDKQIYVINNDQASIGELFPKEDNDLSYEGYRDVLVIVLDTPRADRISNNKWNLADKVIRIDHHPTPDTYSDIAWVNAQAAATSEMIVEFSQHWPEFSIFGNKPAAAALYTGIVTDTGRFRYSSVTEKTFAAAQACIREGINTQEIFDGLYLEDLESLKFRAELLTRVQTTKDNVVYLILDREFQNKFNLAEDRMAEAIDEISRIKNYPVYVVFMALSDRSWRCRMRSRSVTINGVAMAYGGGGHPQAAGCLVGSYVKCLDILEALGNTLRVATFEVKEEN